VPTIASRDPLSTSGGWRWVLLAIAASLMLLIGGVLWSPMDRMRVGQVNSTPAKSDRDSNSKQNVSESPKSRLEDAEPLKQIERYGQIVDRPELTPRLRTHAAIDNPAHEGLAIQPSAADAEAPPRAMIDAAQGAMAREGDRTDLSGEMKASLQATDPSMNRPLKEVEFSSEPLADGQPPAGDEKRALDLDAGVSEALAWQPRVVLPDEVFFFRAVDRSAVGDETINKKSVVDGDVGTSRGAQAGFAGGLGSAGESGGVVADRRQQTLGDQRWSAEPPNLVEQAASQSQQFGRPLGGGAGASDKPSEAVDPPALAFEPSVDADASIAADHAMAKRLDVPATGGQSPEALDSNEFQSQRVADATSTSAQSTWTWQPIGATAAFDLEQWKGRLNELLEAQGFVADRTPDAWPAKPSAFLVVSDHDALRSLVEELAKLSAGRESGEEPTATELRIVLSIEPPLDAGAEASGAPIVAEPASDSAAQDRQRP
jgi:hypothetical protein